MSWLPVAHTVSRSAAISAPPAEPPSRLIVRIADKTLPFGGEWECAVAPGQITIVERGEIYNPVFRCMSRYIIGQTATIDTYLRALTRYLHGR